MLFGAGARAGDTPAHHTTAVERARRRTAHAHPAQTRGGPSARDATRRVHVTVRPCSSARGGSEHLLVSSWFATTPSSLPDTRRTTEPPPSPPPPLTPLFSLDANRHGDRARARCRAVLGRRRPRRRRDDGRAGRDRRLRSRLRQLPARRGARVRPVRVALRREGVGARSGRAARGERARGRAAGRAKTEGTVNLLCQDSDEPRGANERSFNENLIRHRSTSEHCARVVVARTRRADVGWFGAARPANGHGPALASPPPPTANDAPRPPPPPPRSSLDPPPLAHQVCVGAFQACAGTLRSRVIPDAIQARHRRRRSSFLVLRRRRRCRHCCHRPLHALFVVFTRAPTHETRARRRTRTYCRGSSVSRHPNGTNDV